MAEPILEVKGLKTYFYTEEGVLPGVDGLDFTLEQGKAVSYTHLDVYKRQARYNNRFAVIIPCAAHCRKRECPYLYHYFHAASSSRRSARASCSVSAENRNAPVRSNTSTCPRTHSIVYSIMTDTPFKQSGPAGVHQRRTPISYRRCARYPALAALLHCRIIKR